MSTAVYTVKEAADVAAAVGTGTHPSTIHQWEMHESRPGGEAGIRWARLMAELEKAVER